jgi:long-chain acyl-CoA synthetase
MVTKKASIDDVFRSMVEQYPQQAAIIFTGRKYTFSELDQIVQKIASYLYHKGVKKGERAVIYLPHMPLWVGSWLALQRIGAAAVPVTHFYGYEELAYIVKDCSAATIFCSAANLDQAIKASIPAPPKRIILLDGNLPELELPSALRETELAAIDSILSDNNLPALPPMEIEPTALAELLYTGGTTGFPKGVPLTNILLLEAMDTKRNEFVSLVPKGNGVAIQGAPLNHILGQELGLGSLLSGDAMVLLPKLDLADLFAHIQKYGVTTFYCTPTLCRMILEHEKLNDYDFSSLKYVFTAGEALPGEVARRWQEQFKHILYHGYGSTETCGGITGTPVMEQFPEGTCGKLVHTKIAKLVNPDTMEPVPVNEPGELLISSDNMVKEYWNKPEETALHFVEMDGRIWYKTGDIVRFDKDGWVFFVDRSANMIKHKGYRVAAVKVEAALYTHDAVFECCAIGIPDEKVGEKVKGFVVLKSGKEDTDPAELIKWCGERLASYEVPADIEIRDTLPKSAVGKILRRLVRDEERQKMKSQ